MKLKLNPITGKLDMTSEGDSNADCDCDGIELSKINEWIEKADNKTFNYQEELAALGNEDKNK